MKIIIVNYRYFISGGPERYLFNITDILEKNGHEIIPFSIKNSRNKPTSYDNYFINPIGGDEVYFSDVKKTNIKSVIKSFFRMFYSFEAKRKLNSLIKAVNPDLIYVLHYQNKISASIFDAAVKNKIPVVHRISDFGQICANALFYRPGPKDICELCLAKSKFHAISNKCVYDSYIYSSIKVASIKFQQVMQMRKKVEAFVIPSKFTMEKLRKAGFPPERMVHIPSFFNFKLVSKEQEITYEPFALYVGRIESEKGLLTLVKAFENTTFSLKIIGFSNTGFDEKLKDYLKGKDHRIEFLGQMEFDEIQNYLSKCAFTVVPSEWYDNFPNTLLESFAFKKCAIATNTGSLTELVIDNETGLLFKLKDFQDLRSKVAYLLNDEALCRELGENAFTTLNKKYTGKGHYDNLINLFGSVIKNYPAVKKVV